VRQASGSVRPALSPGPAGHILKSGLPNGRLGHGMVISMISNDRV
jgi:hypothetical protein